MLYATNIFPGDGGTRQFEITFVGGYLNKSHVKVYVEDAVTKLRSPIDMGTVTWLGPYTIQLPTATPTGSNTVVARETPLIPIVDFQGSSRITEANLDVAHRQGLFVATESLDSTNSQVVAELKEAILNSATWAEQAEASAVVASTQASMATTKAAEAASSAAASAASVASVGALALSTGSGNVGHIASGVGAAATTARDKLRESVSVFDSIPLEERAAITAGTSTYDCTAAVQAALTAAAGKTLIANPGWYKITGPLNGLSNTRLVGYGATFDISAVPDGSVGTDRCVLDFCGSYGATIALTADALTTDNIVEMADTSSFAEGDLVQVWMNNPGKFPEPSVQVSSGQLNLVTEVQTGKLVLNTSVFDTLTVSNGASIRKITPVENVFVEGITFNGRGRRSDAYIDDRGVGIRYGRNANVVNCKFVDVDLWAARLESCYFGSITGCQATTKKIGSATKINYGFIYSSSQHIAIENNTSANYRHGVVSSHLSSAYAKDYRGVSRFVTITGNKITGNYGQMSGTGWASAHAGIATHTDSQFVLISGNVVTGCVWGINVRGRDVSVTKNILIGNVASGIYLSDEYANISISENVICDTEYAINTATAAKVYDAGAIKITNNTVARCEKGIRLTISNGLTTKGLSIQGNSFTDMFYVSGAAHACIEIETPCSGVVSGNTMANLTVRGIYLLADQSLFINGNTINNSTTYGIYISSASYKSVIKDNSLLAVAVPFYQPKNAQVLSNNIQT